MFEFWAVIGRMCRDEKFHRQLFDLVDHTKPFEDLEPLTNFLRVTNELPLGRWEIAEINRIVAGNYEGDNYMAHASVEDDHEAGAIRFNLPRRELPFPANLNFCAVLGLACTDREFRRLAVKQMTAENLRQEMAKATAVHPKINLTSDEAQELLSLIQEKQAQIAVFHGANWVIPEEVACDGGFSLMPSAGEAEASPTYLHVSQPDMILLLRKRPELLETFLGNRVVQGDTSKLKELFPA